MAGKIGRTELTLPGGETVSAMAPVIVSASRSTDIPAFFAKSFMEKLRRGWTTWVNPFNRAVSYVSFKNTKAIVFWTKNPGPMLKYLPEIDAMGISYYFQYTLNNYEKEGFEPHVLPLPKRIEIFKELSEQIGPERVIWRADPLIIVPGLPVRDLCARIWDLSKALKGLTRKLVFSFVDVEAYRKVSNNLIKTGLWTKADVLSAQPGAAQREEIASDLAKIRDAWHEKGWDFALATCAEGVDLSRYGIEHNRCIDGELMARIFKGNQELMEYLNSFRKPRQNDLFSGGEAAEFDYKKFKDPGQRAECGCVLSKDIGMYNTCSHGCVYCYANTSDEAVKRKLAELRALEENAVLGGTVIPSAKI